MIKIEEFYNEDTLKLFTSPYDPNVYKFKNLGIMGTVQIPLNYETPISNVVYDQGQTSMCSACSSSKIRFYQESDETQSKLTEKLSAGKIYADRGDSDYKGEGMYIADTVAEWKNYGSCLESDFPYYDTYDNLVNKFNSEKDAKHIEEKSEPFKISSYYVCQNREEIQTAILQTKAVQIGIPVYNSFYYPDSNGIVHYKKGESSFGGHAILIRGWKIIDDKFHWVVDNSWGTENWTKNGSCYLPEEYPWQDQATVYVDNYHEMKFKEYREKYGN